MTGGTDGSGSPPLKGLKAAEDAAPRGLPPVHLWNPPYCGDLDIRIHRDGSWSYLGSPIGRPALVRLFSTILRLDDDGRYYLVTPVEKVGISVEDAPFLAVTMSAENVGQGAQQRLTFTTSVGDSVTAGPERPLRFATRSDRPGIGPEPAPYVLIRANLEALIARAVFYDLVALAEEHALEGRRYLGVWSGGAFFPMAAAETLAPV